MAIIFRRKGKDGKPAKNYSIKYKDRNDKWRTVAGCATKELSKQKAHDLEEDVLNRKAGRVDPFEQSRQQPLSEHTEAYRRHLEAKDDCQDHIDRTISRIEAIFEGCKFVKLDDLGAYYAADRVGEYLKGRRTDGLSNKTSNYYLAALKSFCRWAAKQGRMAPSPLVYLDKSSTEADDKRERRSISAKQFATLVKAARNGAETHGLTGEQRAWLYLVAAYTGLRAAELASLTPASFQLRGKVPTVRVRASISKNGEAANQPIRQDLAAMLREWLPEGDSPLWAGRWFRKAAEMLRVDLTAAQIPYKTPAGVFDFHSLRVTYVTELVRSGAHPKIVQTLARHSTIVLTMHQYTKLDHAETAAALCKLPSPAGL